MEKWAREFGLIRKYTIGLAYIVFPRHRRQPALPISAGLAYSARLIGDFGEPHSIRTDPDRALSL